MIGIDIKIPDCCFSCPMSHWIQTGRYEDRLMCNVIERILLEKGDRDTWFCLVDENACTRPDKCPLKDLNGGGIENETHN